MSPLFSFNKYYNNNEITSRNNNKNNENVFSSGVVHSFNRYENYISVIIPFVFLYVYLRRCPTTKNSMIMMLMSVVVRSKLAKYNDKKLLKIHKIKLNGNIFNLSTPFKFQQLLVFEVKITVYSIRALKNNHKEP